MRLILLLMVILALFIVCAEAEEEKKSDQSEEQQSIPTTPAEAHAELERTLPAEVLAEIDAMPSENDMIRYHMGLGLSIRNYWGLWAGGPLAKHMQELGFTHPDDMSCVILETFWCKRHGQDLRMEERTAAARKAIEAQEAAKMRVQKAKATVRDIMMGLHLERRNVPTVRIPTRTGISVRSMCPFRKGVFLTAYCRGNIEAYFQANFGAFMRRDYDPPDDEVYRRPEGDDTITRDFYSFPNDRVSSKMKPGDDFYTLGFYFDRAKGRIHRIRVEEVNEVYAAVVAGERAWFAGLTQGKAVLVGIGERDRITVPLPQDEGIPDLGMDGQSLLAVYAKAVYRLTDREWTLVYSGDIVLPRSGLPPQRNGNMVFLRDEGLNERCKRLWWLTLGEQPGLITLDQDVGLLRAWGPGWDEVLALAGTNGGELWVCVGGWNATSLVRRSQDGSYAIAIMNGFIRFPEDPPESSQAHQRVSVSAVTVLPDNTLLLAGRTGLFRLKGNMLVQELAFIAERMPNRMGTITVPRGWTPSNILMLDERSYLIGTAKNDGVYLLCKGDDGQWSCLPLTDESEDALVW